RARGHTRRSAGTRPPPWRRDLVAAVDVPRAVGRDDDQAVAVGPAITKIDEPVGVVHRAYWRLAEHEGLSGVDSAKHVVRVPFAGVLAPEAGDATADHGCGFQSSKLASREISYRSCRTFASRLTSRKRALATSKMRCACERSSNRRNMG